MLFGSLFTGIGGIDLGLERAGMRCAWQVESDPYCLAVLRKHWPDVPKLGDVRTVREWATLPPVDLIAGGFPCQPVSVAGKRLGQADSRWLWPEFARIVRLVRPRLVFVENVPGLLHRGMGDVLGELAASGYDAEWDCVPASALGAPHRRDRLWIVAHANGRRLALEREPEYGDECGASGTIADGCGEGRRGEGTYVADSKESRGIEPAEKADPRASGGKGRNGSVGRGAVFSDTNGESLGRVAESRGQRGEWAVEPDVGRVASRVPSRVDRLRALGNAVVPQVAEWIGKRIMSEFARLTQEAP